MEGARRAFEGQNHSTTTLWTGTLKAQIAWLRQQGPCNSTHWDRGIGETLRPMEWICFGVDLVGMPQGPNVKAHDFAVPRIYGYVWELQNWLRFRLRRSMTQFIFHKVVWRAFTKRS